ncbi:MAG: hypothetical protein QMD12_00345, partial [Candidatus Aenigmarchaeota archaeon]|nr:hypothetical protein [Candidatus Aenigmarchaeota archaeon]
KKSGVVVFSIEKGSKCGELKEGNIITQVSGFSVKNSKDFKNAIKGIKAGEYVAMVVNGGPGGCVVIKDGDLGISVSDTETKELIFGTDLAGGTITTLKTEKTVSSKELEEIKNIIEKRAKALALPEIRVLISNNSIRIFSLKDENINLLIMNGRFEAKILEEIKFTNNTGKVLVGDSSYPIVLEDKKLKVNGSSYEIGHNFSLENINFEIVNITNTSAFLKALFFSNEDVLRVLKDFSYVKYEPNTRSYEFGVIFEVSKQASQKFAKITRRLSTTIIGAQAVSEGSLVYSLDGEEINKLNIPFEMVGKEIKNIAVIGFRKTAKAATDDKSKIEAALETKELPTGLEIADIELFEPTYGKIVHALVVIVAVLIILPIGLTYLIYKKIKPGLYAMALLASEIISIFGVIALSQSYFARGWLVDMPTIIGLISITCITMIKLFITSEKVIKKREISLQYKYKKIIGLDRLLSILTAVISFVTLFTTWKGFGLSLISGLLISAIIINPTYREILKAT